MRTKHRPEMKMLIHKGFHPNVTAKKEGELVGEMNGDGSEPLPIRHSKKSPNFFSLVFSPFNELDIVYLK